MVTEIKFELPTYEPELTTQQPSLRKSEAEAAVTTP